MVIPTRTLHILTYSVLPYKQFFLDFIKFQENWAILDALSSRRILDATIHIYPTGRVLTSAGPKIIFLWHYTILGTTLNSQVWKAGGRFKVCVSCGGPFSLIEFNSIQNKKDWCNILAFLNKTFWLRLILWSSWHSNNLILNEPRVEQRNCVPP